MTDQVTPLPGETHAAFTVAVTAIPVGIRCRSCGRLHLPVRLWPLAIRARAGYATEVELRCVRCNAVGSLLLDDEDREHQALLSVWRDQATSRAGRDGDRKASA